MNNFEKYVGKLLDNRYKITKILGGVWDDYE